MPANTKPPGQRRRRNADQSKWRTLPREGRREKPPALPTKRPAWLKRTRDWWNAIWASPMATVWEPADLDALVRLAELKDLFARGQAPAVALSAMQQLEDRFGLNPKSRQQMLWQIGAAEAEPEAKPTRRATHLRAV